MDEDYRPDDMLKENARKMERNTQRVWDLKHFVRSQLLAQGEDKVVDDLEYDNEKSGLKVRDGGIT